MFIQTIKLFFAKLFFAKKNPIPEGLDVFSIQRSIMAISDQALPSYPSLTKESILYGALILEEAGETMLALARALEVSCRGRSSDLYQVSLDFAQQGCILINTSNKIKTKLEQTKELPVATTIPFEIAKELLDGQNDLIVVSAGLGQATGLPGMDAYLEVSSSNLSKANPATGKIDKTADGKWIKGANYREPDLGALLRKFYPN